MMEKIVTPDQRRAAKRQIVEKMACGLSLQEARATTDVPMHRATVYRLLQRVRTSGETAFSDGRHGHAVKIRGEVRQKLIDLCQQTPHISSREVQTQLYERFGLRVSVSQLNRVRAALGLSRRGMQREKKVSGSTD